jgi:hypothetical protein
MVVEREFWGRSAVCKAMSLANRRSAPMLRTRSGVGIALLLECCIVVASRSSKRRQGAHRDVMGKAHTRSDC